MPSLSTGDGVTSSTLEFERNQTFMIAFPPGMRRMVVLAGCRPTHRGPDLRDGHRKAAGTKGLMPKS